MRKILLGIMMCLMLMTSVGLVGCGTTPPPSGITTPSDPGDTIPENPIIPENPNTPETPTEPEEPETPEEPTQPETPVILEKTLSDEILEDFKENLTYWLYEEIDVISVESTKTNAVFKMPYSVFDEQGYSDEESLFNLFTDVMNSFIEGVEIECKIEEDSIILKAQKTELN